ncbi:MAG: dephospho-CoA kinase [Coprobacillus sp.]
MVRVIGLTGSIAVGKSTVTHYLQTHGYEVLDADEISRHALDKGTSCYNEVKDIFGCLCEDGSIDRQKLGDIVFHDSQKKKQLEDIIHPYVIQELKKGIQESKQSFMFLDIPLLFEVHLESLCDKIVVVYIDETTQVHRLMERNHISYEDAFNLIQQQISIEEKKTMADYVIDNRLSLENLYQDIERVLEVLKDETIYE